MPAKKAKPVATPLELLAQLSRSLLDHLGVACEQAVEEVEELLAKLEKQRGKTQEKLAKARAKLEQAGNAGKTKAQGKAREQVVELEEMLTLLQARQAETLAYVGQLKRDIERSLELAGAIVQVEREASEAQQAPTKSQDKTAATRTRSSATRTTSRTRKPAAEQPAAPAAKAPRKAATAKPAASNPRAGSRATANAAAPGKPAAAKPAARKPAARKPAAAKPASADIAATAQPASDS